MEDGSYSHPENARLQIQVNHRSTDYLIEVCDVTNSNSLTSAVICLPIFGAFPPNSDNNQDPLFFE